MMKNGSYDCMQCGKSLASSQSLWNHKQRCKGIGADYRRNDRMDIPTFNGAEFLDGNPSRETMEQLEKHVQRTTPQDIPTFNASEFLGRNLQRETMEKLTKHALQEPQLKNISDTALDGGRAKERTSNTDVKKVVPSKSPVNRCERKEVVPSALKAVLKPTTLGELWAKDGKLSESDDSDNDDDDIVEIEDDGDGMDPPKVVFLPASPSKLQARFDKLFREFMLEHKRENRNELVFILDELLRQKAISPLDYQTLSWSLAQSLESSGIDEKMDDEDEEEQEEIEVVDDFSRLVQSTTEYSIKHDRDELEKLMKDYEDPALSGLIREYLDEKLPAEDVLAYLVSISGTSDIPRSVQVQYKILIKDIDGNRRRVREILGRIRDAQGEEHLADVLKALARENLISTDQFQKLIAIDDIMELSTVADIIKGAKVGRGMLLLPRARKDLKKMLEENSRPAAEILACLDELLRQKEISLADYERIRKENIGFQLPKHETT